MNNTDEPTCQHPRGGIAGLGLSVEQQARAGVRMLGGSVDPSWALLRMGREQETECIRVLGRYKRFIPVVLAYASLSKDPSTKVGALVLGPDLEERSSGWNGAPRGSKADEDHRFANRTEKLFWAVHAEANAVANAARAGHSLKGCTLICTHTPCMSCAKLIVQAGITTVVCPVPTGEFAVRWKEEFGRARSLFAECGVSLLEFATTEE